MEKTLQEQLIELREKTGMNRKEFAEFFQIPYRTMTDWERGERQMPDPGRQHRGRRAFRPQPNNLRS